MTVFEISVLALAASFLLVLCVFLYKLSSALSAWNSKTAEPPDQQDRMTQSLDAVAALLHGVADTTTSIRASEEALRTSLATRENLLLGSPQEIPVTVLLVKSAAHLSEVASQQIRDSGALLKHMGTLTERVGAIKESIDKVNRRALSNQLTAYPRKIKFRVDEELRFEAPNWDGGYHVFKARARSSFHLVCEAKGCRYGHLEEGQSPRGPYLSSTLYELPRQGDLTFVTPCLLHPNSKQRVESFFKFLEGAGIVEKGAKAIETFMDNFFKQHAATATALLGCKATLYLGGAAVPLFLTTVIIVETALETHIENLKKNHEHVEATARVRELLLQNPYGIKDVGGPAHVHFGEWVRRYGEKKGKPSLDVFGGLTRWLDPTAQEFAWLCPEHAYAQIEKYDHLKLLASPASAASAAISVR
jgi:hypothetical protein